MNNPKKFLINFTSASYLSTNLITGIFESGILKNAEFVNGELYNDLSHKTNDIYTNIISPSIIIMDYPNRYGDNRDGLIDLIITRSLDHLNIQ